MQQGSNAGGGLAARTAGMTDEQILDLDLAQFAAGAPEVAPEAAGEPDLWDMPAAPTNSSSAESAAQRGLSAHETLLSPESAVIRTAFPGSTNAAQGAPPPAVQIERAECAGRAGVAEAARGAAGGCGRGAAVARSGQRRGGAGCRLFQRRCPARVRGWRHGSMRAIRRRFARCWRKARACWRRAIRKRWRSWRGSSA